MKRTITAIATATATASAVALAALLIGIPWFLITVAGWPLPTGWPDWSQVWLDLRQLNIPAATAAKALAIVGWLVWCQIVASLAHDIVSRVRDGRPDANQPARYVLPAVSIVVSKLVSGVLSIWLLTASPAAATPPPLPTPTEHIIPDTHPEPAVGAVKFDGHPTLSPAREMAATRATVTVHEGETAWQLAQRALGDGDRVGELLEANGLRSSLDVHAGMELQLPDGVAAPKTTVTVVKGDHLWGISTQRLTDAGIPDPSNAQIAAHVALMVDANQVEIEDPDLIYPDEVFVLPELGEPSPPEPVLPEDPSLNEPTNVPPTTDPAPSTTITTAPPVTDPAADDASQPDTADDSSSGIRADLLLGGGAVATVLAGLILAARRRRRVRGIGGRLWLPHGIEHEVVTAASLSTMRWVGKEISTLVQALDRPTQLPAAPIAIEWSPSGLEVLWSDSFPYPVLDWEVEDGQRSWLLRYDPEAVVTAPELPPGLPGLVTIGHRPGGGTVAIDTEAIGSLAVTGDSDTVHAVIRSIVTEAGAPNELSNATILLVGEPSESALRLPNIMTVPAAEALSQARTVAEQTRNATSDPFASLRLRTSGSADESVIVVVTDPATPELAELIETCQPWSGTALIAAGPTDAEATFEVHPGSGTLSWHQFPQALHLTPVGLTTQTDSDFAAMLDQLATDATPDAPDAWSETVDAMVDEPPPEAAEPDFAQTEGAAPTPEANGHDPVGNEASDGPEYAPTPAEYETGDLPELTVPLIRVLGDIGCEQFPKLDGVPLRVLLALAEAGDQGLTTEQLLDRVWDGRAVSKKTVSNTIGKARRWVGPDILPRRQAAENAVAEGIMTDLQWFKTLVTEGSGRSSTIEQACLEKALALVNGPPYSSPGLDWTDFSRQEAEILIEDATLRLVQLALESGDIELAKYGIRQGQLGLGANERLTRARMRIAAAEHDPLAIVQSYKQLERDLLHLLDDPTPSPETTTLKDQLLAQLRHSDAGRVEA